MLNGPMWQTCHDGLADTEVVTVAPMLPVRRSKSDPGVHNGHKSSVCKCTFKMDTAAKWFKMLMAQFTHLQPRMVTSDKKDWSST